MIIIPNEDPILHLEKDILEAEKCATAADNHSREYWQGRLFGLQHALEIVKCFISVPSKPLQS